MTTGSLPTTRLTPGRAILLGGLVVGSLDALDAIVFFGLRSGAKPARIFQGIAGGLLGRATFDGGALTVALGVALHFCIATSIVTTYVLASRKLELLTRRPVLCGVSYGIAVYAFMNLVVIPLSALTARVPAFPVFLNGITIHMFGVGLPSALFARAARGVAS